MTVHTFVSSLLPHRCPVCGSCVAGAGAGPGAGAVVPCAGCAADLPPPPALPPPPGLDACHAAVAYRDGGRAIVAAIKFRGANGPLPWVAEELAARIAVGGLDVVCWIPTTPAHRRHRGRDQAESVARALARRLSLPAVPLLRRLPGPPQALRAGSARRAGPPLALSRRFAPLAESRLGPALSLARDEPVAAAVSLGVLVVDDVVTSGGSMAAAARVLRAGGATRVVGAAVARTPPGWFR